MAYTPVANPKKRGPKPKPKNVTDIIKEPKLANNPNIQPLPEGDNNKYTTFALAIMKFPPIDVTKPEQLGQRIVDYFQLCADHDMKPGVAALGLAVGLDRRRLWEINNDVQGCNTSLPQESRNLIKSAYNSLEVLWESWSTGGKLNPVTAIFLGKNNFGYADKQEYVLTPNQTGTTIDPTTIEAKYAELPDMGGEDE